MVKLPKLTLGPDEVAVTAYDIDDTLTNLTEWGLQLSGIPKWKFNHFKIQENLLLSEEDKENLFARFHAPDTFWCAEFMPGAKEITQLNGDRNQVHLNSNNFSQGVLDVKMYRCTHEIPDMTEDRIHMHMNRDHSKPLPPGTRIVVDDHYGLLIDYPPEVIRIVIDKQYNPAKLYGVTDEQTGIIRAYNLIHCNDMIYYMLLDAGVKGMTYTPHILR